MIQPTQITNPNEMAKLAIMTHQRLGWPVEQYPADTVSFAAILDRAGFDPVAMSSDLRTELHGLVRWLQSGLPVLRPSLDLASGLVLTDPSDVRGEEWKFPFNTFLIHVPHDIWLIEGGKALTYDQETGEALEVYSADDTYVTMVMVHTYLDSYDHSCVEVRAIARSGLGLFSRFILPPLEAPIGEWLAKTGTTKVKDSPIPLAGDEPRIITEIWRLVINLCLFVTGHGKGQSEARYTTKKARRRHQERGVPMSGPEVWVLGKEIKLDKELIAAAKSRTTGRGWKVRSRWVVRGHFTNQAYGPRHSLRKRMWIKPHYSGKTAGERISHLYTVGEDDNEEG
jgi:hypothetical protein